jgi:hypothetical protein
MLNEPMYVCTYVTQACLCPTAIPIIIEDGATTFNGF